VAVRTPQPSASVTAAKARREAVAGRSDVRIDWYIENVMNKVRMSMRKRMLVAVEFLRSQVTKNISRPVTVGTGPKGGRVVTNRSKTGEFPKKDFGLLFRSIFGDVKESGDMVDGFVGLPLGYGVVLETNKRLDRKFLTRTMYEEQDRLKRMLTGPVV